jgi:hypothetical protein
MAQFANAVAQLHSLKVPELAQVRAIIVRSACVRVGGRASVTAWYIDDAAPHQRLSLPLAVMPCPDRDSSAPAMAERGSPSAWVGVTITSCCTQARQALHAFREALFYSHAELVAHASKLTPLSMCTCAAHEARPVDRVHRCPLTYQLRAASSD